MACLEVPPGSVSRAAGSFARVHDAWKCLIGKAILIDLHSRLASILQAIRARKVAEEIIEAPVFKVNNNDMVDSIQPLWAERFGNRGLNSA